MTGTRDHQAAQEGADMITITGRPEVVAAFIASVQLSARELLVQPPAEEPTTTDAPNVVPLRRPTGKRRSAS